jgi:hypothetical protein
MNMGAMISYNGLAYDSSTDKLVFTGSGNGWVLAFFSPSSMSINYALNGPDGMGNCIIFAESSNSYYVGGWL